MKEYSSLAVTKLLPQYLLHVQDLFQCDPFENALRMVIIESKVYQSGQKSMWSIQVNFVDR